jgi:hypothetical protein
MGMRMYSERLGVLDDTQFQTALERFGLGTFIQATPARGGAFGQNIFITSTTGAWVLRGSPHYDWQFPAEQFFCKLLHERTQRRFHIPTCSTRAMTSLAGAMS